MKKVILVCGITGGLIVAAMLVITTGIYHASGNFRGGMLIGYASMIIAFSLIFVGIKTYRDKYSNGVISFGKAFQIGLYITLIASSIYVITWLIDYYYFLPDFNEKYTEQVLDKLKAGGASAAEIAQQTKRMASFSALYKNPFFNALLTYMEIVPVGLLVTLISSLVLKRKIKPAL